MCEPVRSFAASNGRDVVVYATARDLRAATAHRLLDEIASVLRLRGRADVALTGGRDGNGMMAVMASLVDSSPIDWSRVHFWWGDERFVGAGDGDRNDLQARDALLDGMLAKGLIGEGNLHPMPSLPASVAADKAALAEAASTAASVYERELREQLGDDGALDVVMFGVGEDGHCASMFPNAPELSRTGWVTGVLDSPKPPPTRISLTLPFIRRSRKVWFCSSGEGKARAVAAALDADPCEAVPSSLVVAREQTLWLLDSASAGLVSGMRG